MTQKATCLAVICLLVSAAAPKKPQTFHLLVPGLSNGDFLPLQFTCNGNGGNLSPPLIWSGEPKGTQSFALIMDAPAITGFANWILWDIPASAHSLEAGARDIGVPGTNGLGDRVYDGPCPPGETNLVTGPPTIYTVHLFALDLPALTLKAGKGKDALEQAIRKHVLAKAEFEVRYGGHRL